MYTPQQSPRNRHLRVLIGFDSLMIAMETSLIDLLNLPRLRLSNYTQKTRLKLPGFFPNYQSKLNFLPIIVRNTLTVWLSGQYLGDFWKKTVNLSALKVGEVITKNVLILDQIANLIDYFPFIRDEDPEDLLVGIVIRDSIC